MFKFIFLWRRDIQHYQKHVTSGPRTLHFDMHLGYAPDQLRL